MGSCIRVAWREMNAATPPAASKATAGSGRYVKRSSQAATHRDGQCDIDHRYEPANSPEWDAGRQQSAGGQCPDGRRARETTVQLRQTPRLPGPLILDRRVDDDFEARRGGEIVGQHCQRNRERRHEPENAASSTLAQSATARAPQRPITRPE